jgi:glycerol-3-phosphate acyltransferase PlsY
LKEFVVILGAYLVGCLSTGYYLVRWRRGIDIRTVGSGTTGAFNVARVLRAPGFVITLAGDVLKGWAALAVARYLEVAPWALLLALVAVVLGHDFPVQLGFRGGNGLATASGGLLVFDLQLAIALAILFCLSLPVLGLLKAALKLPIRYYTPSKVTVLAAPLMALALGRAWWVAPGLALVVAVILWTIRGNLRRLAQELKPGGGPVTQ